MKIYSKILLISNISYFSNYFIEEKVINFSFKKYNQYWLIQKLNINNNLSEVTSDLLSDHFNDNDISVIVYLPFYDFKKENNIKLFRKELSYLSMLSTIYNKIILTHDYNFNNYQKLKKINFRDKFENITILNFNFEDFKLNHKLNKYNYNKITKGIFDFLILNSPK